jgi:hypothetical protein
MFLIWLGNALCSMMRALGRINGRLLAAGKFIVVQGICREVRRDGFGAMATLIIIDEGNGSVRNTSKKPAWVGMGTDKETQPMP